MKHSVFSLKSVQLLLPLLVGLGLTARADLAKAFLSPPTSSRPWTYWFVMDGNLTRDGITADFEALQRAGIGGIIMMEVDVGIPRGPVKFMSEEWRGLFQHAVAEAERLGLAMTLNAGPGWTGSGGPWVKPEESMQHLVGAATNVVGPARFEGALPRPLPRTPFFGEGTLTPELAKAWKEFYRDEAVLAFPTPKDPLRIADIDEKAIYYRAPYSSQPGVKSFLPFSPSADETSAGRCVDASRVLDLTARLGADGRLTWDVPSGHWTVVRFGRTTTGQVTRPAPVPGLGFECDKFDPRALDAHFAAFVETLLRTVGPHRRSGAGWTMLHIDSWEMGAQNWSAGFRDAFRQRRGYDPLPYLPAMLGQAVGSPEISERFLWDLRRTAQQLVVENHAMRLRQLGRRHGLGLSIEPYDMNPAGDLALGGVADVPMGEFWSKGFGFDTEYSVVEAVSVAHTAGRPIVAAESFTSYQDGWRQFPGAVKAQGDWALCAGLNRIVFHRYQHQPWLDRAPGMTFGPYGVHWDRTQTWWDMASGYHTYLSRCQTLLRRGAPVADILYLTPEGAPQVFRAPASAFQEGLPDRRGYNFDGCAPDTLMQRATVERGRIAFADGASYRVLVLPKVDTMTPALLDKIRSLVKAGATVMGTPPRQSPSLEGYPGADASIQHTAVELWGDLAESTIDRRVGKGRVIELARPRRATPERSPLADAHWIWLSEGNPATAAAVGRVRFRRELVLPADAQVESAQAHFTADNGFDLSVNRQPIGSGDNFHQVYRFDLSSVLRPGTNLIEVVATNGGESPNPAGLIGCLIARLKEGREVRFVTDDRWQSTFASGENRATSASTASEWRPVRDLGPMTMAPWNLSAEPAQEPELYDAYDATAEVLRRLGLPPDFECDGSVRYTHRRDRGVDIYFVANRDDRPSDVRCTFRVTGKQPELWDPITGQRRDLPSFSFAGGRTTVPLRFEPHEAFFVVFRRSATSGKVAGANFRAPQPLSEITGPWEVSFDPKWGGPANVTFASLADWTKRSEEGLRFYSGKAVYRCAFEAPPTTTAVRRSLFLDLGKVRNIAQVRLNGRDLGIVWCAPWRVEVTNALRTGANSLEITVANLWPNRLIGDAALPAEKRLTWTTWSPYKPDSPLMESGLLGPVRLVGCDR